MCGIAGIIAFDGRDVSEAELRCMTDRMFKRGPDDEGFVTSRSVGVGMRRLSIIDVDGGHQPLSNESGDIHLALNGEIYNHLELREQLLARGHVFRTRSDAEVVLHLYEEKGVEALSTLNGMFAFALYDERRSAVWLARDRLGIKPLFYATDDSGLYFASDIRALRSAYSTSVDASTVLGYLALGYAPADTTVWHGVRKLPPAHHLWLENGHVTLTRYWSVRDFATWRGSATEASQKLEALAIDAVRLQLRSDVPLGVFLSGGLDSSTITALAAQQLPEPLQTFTVSFDGKDDASDVVFARQVAARYTTSHVELNLTAGDASLALDALLPFMDEPIADSAIIPSYWLSRAARDRGIKVLLSGAGGDEIFCGYGRHRGAAVGTPRWFADVLPAPLRHLVAATWSAAQPRHGMRVKHPAYAWGATVTGINLHIAKQLMRDPSQFDDMLGTMRREYRGIERRGSDLGFAHARMHLDLETYLPDNVLALTDKATMGASVEGRVPLLDHRLVEFAFSLPEAMNALDGRPKGLLQRAMRDRLSCELLTRRKEGFNAPVVSWLRDDTSFDVTSELLDHSTPLMDELVSRRAIEHVLASAERRLHAGPFLFTLFLLNRWHRAQLGS